MTIQELKEKHPQIAFWMDALEQSEKDTSGQNKEYYAFVKAFYHAGSWQALPNTPGKHKQFEKSLKSVLERNPDAIRVIFSESSGGTKGRKEFEVKLSETEITSDEKENAVLGEIKELRTSLEEIKKTPSLKSDNSPNTDIIIMQNKFEHKMEMIEVNTRHRAEVDHLNRTIEKLEEEIDELKEEIEEYENDVKLGESQLGDLERKLEEKVEKETSLEFILKKSLEKAGQNLITKNVATLGALLEVDENTIKEALAKDERFQKSIESRSEEPESTTSFAEVKDRAPEHQRGLDDMIKLLGDLPLDQFKFVYQLITAVQNPDATINTELAAQLIGLARDTNK